MSNVLQLIASSKNSRVDGKVKVLSQISDLLKNQDVTDNQEKAIEDLISLLNSSIKAPQLPLALKAIEIAVTVLEFLISDSQPLKTYVTLILPNLLERLGDAKERALVDSWRILSVGDSTKESGPQRRTKALEHFSKLLIEIGFTHKAPWGREQSLSLCINCIAKDPDFPLQKFTMSALSLAEDNNEAVREIAKTLLLDFFPVVSQESKTSLQRALADSDA
ncbi:suppressor of tub2 mutation [Entomophthora muscae]|uniref:Suppressor of tub2 mutation n=1 Tax=Entomophthora muscae TaxID=34485 RepID=A0ACC2RF04_9FUNG|nr:suppressor of tub2 mutation [Entomophthora muscae]